MGLTEGAKIAKKFLYLVIENYCHVLQIVIFVFSDFDKQLALKYRFNRLKSTTILMGLQCSRC